MKSKVTVIPDDNLIIVDQIPLWFSYDAPENLHALQWDKECGHIEWTDDFNHPLTVSDYEFDVAPFVRAWESERVRLEEEANRPPTLEEVKVAKLTEINMACDAAMSTLTAGYPSTELLTFDKQETEARAYVVNPSTSTPLLTALASGRGIPLANLVQRVIAKADAFSALSGSIIGQRQALEDQVDAATTMDGLNSIKVKFKDISEMTTA